VLSSDLGSAGDQCRAIARSLAHHRLDLRKEQCDIGVVRRAAALDRPRLRNTRIGQKRTDMVDLGAPHIDTRLRFANRHPGCLENAA
jgi:hypothetical protein